MSDDTIYANITKHIQDCFTVTSNYQQPNYFVFVHCCSVLHILGPVLMNYKLAKHVARRNAHATNCSESRDLSSTLDVGTCHCLSFLIAKLMSG